MFAERGFNGAATAEIARRAGVAEGSIYRHFADKNELFLACVTPVVGDGAAVNVADLESADARTVVRSMLEFRLRLMQENLESFNILFTQAPFHPELANLFVDRVILGRTRKAASALTRLYQEGKLRRQPNDLVHGLGILAALWAILNFRGMVASRPSSFPGPIDPDTVLEDLVDMVLYGLIGESPQTAEGSQRHVEPQ